MDKKHFIVTLIMLSRYRVDTKSCVTVTWNAYLNVPLILHLFVRMFSHHRYSFLTLFYNSQKAILLSRGSGSFVIYTYMTSRLFQEIIDLISITFSNKGLKYGVLATSSRKLPFNPKMLYFILFDLQI